MAEINNKIIVNYNIKLRIKAVKPKIDGYIICAE
jgi:hypothetical protein